MEITGNKKIDPFIKLTSIIVGAYGLYEFIKFIGPSINPGFTPGSGSPAGPGSPAGCTVNFLKEGIIRKQMDKIYNKLNGYNVYNFPSEVNVILGYDNCEIKYANDYFVKTYGPTLYTLISGEWDLDGDYSAAENKLKSEGLGY